MAEHPQLISSSEHSARIRRARGVARRLGFGGRIEYRHVFSNAGGAQYGLGVTLDDDLLVVYADAFERDGDPDDFSLEAIVAHERGHQLLCRDPRLRRLVSSLVAEEIMASLVGSLIALSREDSEALFLKALAETLERGLEPSAAARLVSELRNYLEKML